MPVRFPMRENATARFAVSDDLPTPPLPDATEITRQVAGSRMTLSRSGAPPRSSAVSACAGPPPGTPRGPPLPLLGRHDVEREREAAHAGDVLERALDLLLERVA